MTEKPNVLVIIVDELRYPLIYESEDLKKYSEGYVWNEMKKDSMYFEKHYCAATACVPSRTVLYTGQMGILTGPINTDGAAKSARDSDMYWLDPQTVPTFGHFFREAGYKTNWIGKWHISNPDLYVPGTDIIINTYDEHGKDVDEKIRLYQKTNRLSQYGFDNWIGPTPHGPSPLNTGDSAKNSLGRDQSYTEQAVKLLDDLNKRDDPWLIVLSYVNPHDIALYGLATNNENTNFDFSVSDEIPKIIFNKDLFDITHNESLLTKPTAQQSYHDAYKNWFPDPLNQIEYQRVYYNLQKKVSDQIRIVLNKLSTLNMTEKTLIIFTSDHGDLLGSHGNLHQKWYNAYEETVHIPFLIHWKEKIKGSTSFPLLSSHLDFVPTLLGLCNISHVLNYNWENSFIQYQPLPGRNLTDLIFKFSKYDPSEIITDELYADNPIFFMTDDDIARGVSDGAQGSNFLGLPPKQIEQPTHIISIFVILTKETLSNLDIVVNEKYNLVKYNYYYDYVQSWTNPQGSGISLSIPDNINPTQPIDDLTIVFRYVDIDNYAQANCQRLFKENKIKSEFELYILSSDPLEVDNLSSKSQYLKLKTYLSTLLYQECTKKRLLPLYFPDSMRIL